MPWLPSHPLLDPDEARALEQARLGGDEAREWDAMTRAGAGVAAGVLRDLAAVGINPRAGSVLVLAGKGHNAGDALIAAGELLRQDRELQVDVGFVYGTSSLRPLAARAWRELVHEHSNRVRNCSRDTLGSGYTLVLDGIFGFQYRPPLDPAAAAWIAAAMERPVAFRASVDLPSGWDAPAAFRADATYATGALKRPLLELRNAGRIRFVDLGFFSGDEPGSERIIAPTLLRSLNRPRAMHSDKRTYGHVFVVGGSRSYPGAVLMSVQAALHSGVGLVSAFVPESLAPAYAAAWPEAMWHGCPETNDGGLAVDTAHAIRTGWPKATAWLIGPGMAREPETLALATALLRESTLPVVIDADALQAQAVWSGSCPRIFTPHAGEFERIANGTEFREFRPTTRAVTVLKGPITRITDGAGTIYSSIAGGPVLARGGSGDLLAGLIAGLLAQNPGELLRAAITGVAWHGAAADRLAVRKGEIAVRTTDLVEELGPALREA